jgi:hypothetical protein
MSERKRAGHETHTEHEEQTEPHMCMRELAIVERYERYLDYVYPIFIGIRRAHYIMRDKCISDALEQVRLFDEAGKSQTLTKLYAADAGVQTQRFNLRFLADPRRKLISRHQLEVAAIHLAETGKMLGAWIRSARATKR